MRRGPGPTKQDDNIPSYVCLNYKDGSTQTPTFPTGACPQGLRTQVLFPSCWNGKDLVSSDHSHVVYPMGDNADNGDCPSSHPVRLPTLFYEFIWDVSGQTNANSTWVFSNGDSIGYSMHADFIAAWNETILQDAIDQCAGNLFNNLESCPPLNLTLNRKASDACTATSTAATSGSLAALPGCNMIWNGPHAGKGLAAGCDPNKVMLKPDNYQASNTTSGNMTSTASTSSTSLASSSTVQSTSSSVAPTSTSALISSSSSSASSQRAPTAAAAGIVGNAVNRVSSVLKSAVKQTPKPQATPQRSQPKPANRPHFKQPPKKQPPKKNNRKDKKRPRIERIKAADVHHEKIHHEKVHH